MKGCVSILMLSVVALGCSRRDASIESRGPEARADVRRISHDQNGEIWRGRTIVFHGAIQITVDEEVSFDVNGGLIRGFTRVEEAGRTVERWISRSSGVVTVQDGIATSFHPPTDRPWMYGPIETASAGRIATPLGAWIAFRAQSAVIRLIGSADSTIVQSSDVLSGIEVDQQFVQVLRGGRVAFVREPSHVDGTFAFRAPKS